jgi:hypothetical protein
MTMRPILRPVIGAAIFGLAAADAAAVDVDFTGTVSNACTLTVTQPGTLGLSTGYTILGSWEGGGVEALLTLASLGANTLTIDPPVVQSAPAAYDPTGETLEVAYWIDSLSIEQEWIASRTTQTLSAFAPTTLAVDAQVTNPNAFPEGSYTLRVVVTCAPS